MLPFSGLLVHCAKTRHCTSRNVINKVKSLAGNGLLSDRFRLMPKPHTIHFWQYSQ